MPGLRTTLIALVFGPLSPALAQVACTGDSAVACKPAPPCRWNAIGKICSMRSPALITLSPAGYDFELPAVDPSSLPALAGALSPGSRLTITAPADAAASPGDRLRAIITAVPPDKARELCLRIGAETNCLPDR